MVAINPGSGKESERTGNFPDFAGMFDQHVKIILDAAPQTITNLYNIINRYPAGENQTSEIEKDSTPSATLPDSN